MKKSFISILCMLLLFGMLLVSCSTPTPPAGEGSTPEESTTEEGTTEEGTTEEGTTEEGTTEEGTTEEGTTEEGTTEDLTSAECAHQYELAASVDALALRDGSEEYVCSLCQDSYTETIPATDSIKILALGNSFTVDGTHHLWNICKDGGVENVIVGNLYIGNCTLDKHWSNISDNKAAYTYYKNTNDAWVTTENFTVEAALKQEDWDFIVLHQTSGSAGFADSFVHLNKIIKFFNDNKTNPDAKIIWHMPWAYQSDSAHAEFPKYGQNQTVMYEMIVDRVQELILPKDTISAVIPSGTAIQNLRTSYVGDYVTRDGYHLNYGFGRYTAALTWFAVLTGGDISVVDWIPPKFPDVASFLPAIKDAVASAMETPFEPTTSAYTSEVVPVPERQPIDPSATLNPADSLQADTALAAAFGVDLTKYQLLEWNYLENSYWYCTSKAGTTTPKSTASTYHQNICSAKKYSVEDELPVGTIFICDPGWRFRMEIYPSATGVYQGIRPEGSTAPFYVLSEDFLNGCTYIAWSVSTDPKVDISAFYAQAYAHVRVYVPIQQDAAGN